MAIEIKSWELTQKGKETHLYYLRNNNGMEAVVSDFGACLISLIIPDKTGKKTDVVLGLSAFKPSITQMHLIIPTFLRSG